MLRICQLEERYAKLEEKNSIDVDKAPLKDDTEGRRQQEPIQMCPSLLEQVGHAISTITTKKGEPT